MMKGKTKLSFRLWLANRVVVKIELHIKNNNYSIVFLNCFVKSLKKQCHLFVISCTKLMLQFQKQSVLKRSEDEC